MNYLSKSPVSRQTADRIETKSDIETIINELEHEKDMALLEEMIEEIYISSNCLSPSIDELLYLFSEFYEEEICTSDEDLSIAEYVYKYRREEFQDYLREYIREHTT